MKHQFHLKSSLPHHLFLSAIILTMFSCASRSVGGRQGESSYRKSEYPGSQGGVTRDARSDQAKDKSSGEKEETRRMVIYTASLGLKVINIENTLARVEKITREFQGYVQSSASRNSYKTSTIVVRIPVKKFQEAFKKFAGLGKLFEHKIRAEDVTSEFLDVKLRLELALKTRERLYVILGRTTDIKERIQILKEIERLSRIIEMFSARKDELTQKTEFSTITITLETQEERIAGFFLPSPFSWIALLKPFQRSIFTFKDLAESDFETPPYFLSNWYQFKKGYDSYIYFSPDQTRVRLGNVDNYPKGNLDFWHKALALECQSRGYLLAKDLDLSQTGKADKKGRILIYKINEGLNTYYYGLYLAIRDDKILIMETDFPNEKAFIKHSSNIIKMIQSFHEKA
jgi:hypothetical protein